MQLNGSYGKEKSYVRDFFFFFLVMIIIIVKTQGPPTMISS